MIKPHNDTLSKEQKIEIHIGIIVLQLYVDQFD